MSAKPPGDLVANSRYKMPGGHVTSKGYNHQPLAVSQVVFGRYSFATVRYITSLKESEHPIFNILNITMLNNTLMTVKELMPVSKFKSCISVLIVV